MKIRALFATLPYSLAFLFALKKKNGRAYLNLRLKVSGKLTYFKVETESILQQAIQANKNSGTIINIGPFNLTLFDIGIPSISVVILIIIGVIWKKKRIKHN